MSILTRLTNRLRPQRLERDLQDEIQCHIEMRASQHLKAGMSADEATRRAHQQFGDINAVAKGMRQARLSSVMTLFAMTSLLAALALIWIAQQRI